VRGRGQKKKGRRAEATTSVAEIGTEKQVLTGQKEGGGRVTDPSERKMGTGTGVNVGKRENRGKERRSSKRIKT